MRPPERAAKLRAFLKTDIIEGDAYEGFLLDTNSGTPSEFVTYEIPIANMALGPESSTKLTQMVPTDEMVLKEILFEVHSPEELEATFDIQKIDIVFNPEIESDEF